jgi:quinohemoprotein ethanol dehydrogenase
MHTHSILRKTFKSAGAITLIVTTLFTRGSSQTTTNNTNWPSYGNDLGAMRFQNLDQINPSNVATLQPAWIFHTTVMNMNTSFESQPIIIDGVLYVSSPHGHVFALDATTGALKWTFNPNLGAPLSELAICCGQTNRGVAVGDGRVYVGQLDATLIALDASNGQQIWKVTVDRWQDRWTETMAPLFINGKVIIGASGGEYMRRGHVRAYEAATGKMLWEFNTTAAPGEFGSDTWKGDSWKSGGGTVWTTPAADPQLGLLYVTTGNASPDENGSEREGMNLFTASVVALDINTGQRKWHFQEVHHDIWDYDSTQPVHLFTLERGGQQIPALGHANKNGFYFILDRRNGTPLYDVKETPVPTTEPAWQHAWPTQPIPATEPLIPQKVDPVPPNARAAPIYTPPSEQPTMIQPGFESGPEWPPSAHSPRTHYSYLQAGGYMPNMYHAIPPVLSSFGSTAGGAAPGVQSFGLFVAMDTTTGKIAWKKQLEEKMFAGVTVAGDLVFFGESSGKFNALDAKTGSSLWTFQSSDKGVGGANGVPAVYSVNGREFVVMAFGGNNGLSDAGDALIAFALPSGGSGSPNVVTADVKQAATGDLPASAMQQTVQSAPADARVLELSVHDFDFQPQSFTVLAGEKVALHLTNVGLLGGAGITLKLPSGPIASAGSIAPGANAFFVFTAPAQPGVFDFYGPSRFFGMTGVMRVGPDCASPTISPCITAAGVMNAASLRSGAVAPGELVTIFGRGLGPDTGVPFDTSLASLPTTLSATQVLFDNIPAPLLFAQGTQVTAVVPVEVSGKTSTSVQVVNGNGRTDAVTVSVTDLQPGVFSMMGNATRQGTILNQDGTQNSPSNPAAKGSTISMFATGTGQTIPPGVDGAIATNDGAKPQSRIEVLLGGVGADVVNARLSRGSFTGLLQVDAKIPDGAPTGNAVPIGLSAGDVISPPTATVAIK